MIMRQCGEPIADTRDAQRFPVLDRSEIGRLARFGEMRSFAKGDYLSRTGEIGFAISGARDRMMHDRTCGLRGLCHAPARRRLGQSQPGTQRGCDEQFHCYRPSGPQNFFEPSENVISRPALSPATHSPAAGQAMAVSLRPPAIPTGAGAVPEGSKVTSRPSSSTTSHCAAVGQEYDLRFG